MSKDRSPGAHSDLAVFAVVAAAVFLSILDLFIVNVALPSIGTSFKDSLAGLSWVLSAYGIAFAALLVVAGRIGDRTGQRGMFLGGLVLFTGASAVCAVAPDLAVLVGARIVQAAGAAALLPTSLALLLDATPIGQRDHKVRAWAAVGGIAAALGPVIGGLLVQVDWRLVFLVNLPFGLAAFIGGLRVLPRPAPRTEEKLPDLVGAVLLTASIATLTGGLVQGPSWGWHSGRVIGMFVGAGVAFLWFVERCVQQERPLVELRMFRTPVFGTATASVFLFSIGFSAMLLTSVLWCQDVWHYSALRTGLAIAPGPLMMPGVAVASAALVNRIGPGPVAAVGNLLFACGLLWRVAFASLTPSYVGDMLPALLIAGVGIGLALPTLISTSTRALPPERFATGSGVVNTARQVATALGVAIMVTIVGTPLSASAAQVAFRHAWSAAAVTNLLAAGVALTIRGEAEVPGTVPVVLPAEVPVVRIPEQKKRRPEPASVLPRGGPYPDELRISGLGASRRISTRARW